MSKKDFTPKLINTNQKEYDKDRVRFEKYKLDYANTKKSIEEILDLSLDKIDLSKQKAFSEISKAYADKLADKNTLGLSPIKLMNLLELPVESIIANLDKLRISSRPQPNIEDYRLYTTNEAQNDRLAVAKQFISLMDKIGSKVRFDSPINAPIMHIEGKRSVNHYWVRQLKF